MDDVGRFAVTAKFFEAAQRPSDHADDCNGHQESEQVANDLQIVVTSSSSFDHIQATDNAHVQNGDIVARNITNNHIYNTIYLHDPETEERLARIQTILNRLSVDIKDLLGTPLQRQLTQSAQTASTTLVDTRTNDTPRTPSLAWHMAEIFLMTTRRWVQAPINDYILLEAQLYDYENSTATTTLHSIEPEAESIVHTLPERPEPKVSRQTRECQRVSAKDFKNFFSSMSLTKSKTQERDNASTVALPASGTPNLLQQEGYDDLSSLASRKSRDVRDTRSMTTMECSIDIFGRDSEEYPNSDGPAPSPLLSGNKKSFMQNLSRKCSSSKFTLPTFKREKIQRDSGYGSENASRTHPVMAKSDTTSLSFAMRNWLSSPIEDDSLSSQLRNRNLTGLLKSRASDAISSSRRLSKARAAKVSHLQIRAKQPGIVAKGTSRIVMAFEVKRKPEREATRQESSGRIQALDDVDDEA